MPGFQPESIRRWGFIAAVVALPLLAGNWPVSAAKPANKKLVKNVKAGQMQVRPVAAAKTNSGTGITITPKGKQKQNDTPAPRIYHSHTKLTPIESLAAAAKVDSLIMEELQKANQQPAPKCSDEDYLRRVSLDIAGISPSPRDVTLFGLDPDPRKREKVVDRLLESPDYARNWAQYWRDVVFLRATEPRARLAEKPFQTWLEKEFQENRHWDEIATSLLTATGDVLEDGQTGMIFSQSANPDEVAAEASRILLGIQIQCANCHDHPTDHWKRQQFHELAAFFPRMRVQPKKISDKINTFELTSLVVNNRNGVRKGAGKGMGMPEPEDIFANPEKFLKLIDKNGDGKISQEEASRGPNRGRFFDRLLKLGDSDKDGMLSLAEIKKIPPPGQNQRRGSAEHYMSDLKNPASKGTLVDPQFFLGNLKPGEGLSDMDRRKTLAQYFTDPGNPWFARAFVNRIWGSLLGEGFYMPIDDIGPDRTANHPAALDVLGKGFAASHYDIKWLFRAITATQAYQRQMRPKDPSASAPAFAAAFPTRLRADALYDSLNRVLGIEDNSDQQAGPQGKALVRRGDNTPRGQFHQLFNFDPSTLPDDVLGTIPQALFLLNASMTNSLIRAGDSRTPLARILQKYPDDKAALQELYLLVHAREPSESELRICRDYIKQIGKRNEAFEDIFWSLLNSTEFQTRR
jgi:hypothetical protein